MRVRASVIIQEDKRILLMRYRYGGHDVYNLPGGNPDPGETLPACVARELKEELGIKVEVQQLAIVAQGIGQRSGKAVESVLHIIFQGKILAGEPVLNPKETSALEVLWLPCQNLANTILYPAISTRVMEVCEEKFENCPRYIEQFEQIWY